MKKFAAIILTVLFGMGVALAHEMEGGSTKGLFGLKAEYLHVLLNPLPVYGLAMGVLVLALALLAPSKSARNIGLVVIVLCSASAWPVLIFGQHGYNHLYPQLDTESQQWLNVHMERAERFIYAFYLTAVVGVAALGTQKRLLKTHRVLTWLTLVAAAGSLGLGGWISRTGGEASHSEFRSEEAPPPAPAHQHSEYQESPQTNQAHEHGLKPAAENQVPDTIEGIWTELHQRYTELESTVTAKQFTAIHPQAAAIRGLTAKLVEIVHPDHKATVQGGVDEINRAVDGLHKAADAEDEAGARQNLKTLDTALKQLEEQMKKQ